MYTYKIKDNSSALELATTRALLILSGLACLALRQNYALLLHVAAANLLLLSAIFIKKLLYQYRINKTILLAFAALLLAGVTGSIIFAVIIFGMGFVVSFIYKQPQVTFFDESILIEKTLFSNNHSWTSLNFVVLKDGLLTIDFINNKILQVTINNPITQQDEEIFNNYCKEQLKAKAA